MFINPNFYLALPVAATLFFVGRALGLRRSAGIAFFLLALVSLLIPLPYLSDRVGENPAYANFRALPFAELTVCLAASFAGWLSFQMPARRLMVPLCLLIAVGYVSLPFIKPMIRPAGEIAEKWHNGIALQSTAATCGPASLTTLLSRLGATASQREVAQGAYNSGSGTENWYLARYAQSRGFSYRFLNQPELRLVPVPSIIGVRLGSAGHFITLLSKEGEIFTIGDSLSGVSQLTKAQFDERYRFTGFVLHVGRD